MARGAHAVVILDQAGQHDSFELAVPTTFTLLPLSRRRPKLNPVESVQQFMRDDSPKSDCWLRRTSGQIL